MLCKIKVFNSLCLFSEAGICNKDGIQFLMIFMVSAACVEKGFFRIKDS